MCCVAEPPRFASETRLSESGDLRQTRVLMIVRRLFLNRWNVTDWLEQPAVVEPLDPAQGGKLHLLHHLPKTLFADHFRQRIQGLPGHGLVP